MSAAADVRPDAELLHAYEKWRVEKFAALVDCERAEEESDRLYPVFAG
jgi:hypothetical protein